MPPTYCPCNRPILKHTPSHTQHHHSHSPTNTNANANDLLHIDPSVLGQPTVRFPPRATLVTRTFLAHPSEDYDRSPIVVVPNACRLPERGCPGRTYSPTHTRTSLQRRQRSPMSSRKPHSSGGGSGGGGVTTPLPPLVADLTSSSEDDESDSSLAVLPPLADTYNTIPNASSSPTSAAEDECRGRRRTCVVGGISTTGSKTDSSIPIKSTLSLSLSIPALSSSSSSSSSSSPPTLSPLSNPTSPVSFVALRSRWERPTKNPSSRSGSRERQREDRCTSFSGPVDSSHTRTTTTRTRKVKRYEGGGGGGGWGLSVGDGGCLGGF